MMLPSLDAECVVAAQRRPGVVRLVTWNIWFSPLQAQERMAVLFSQALKQAADVICLQEVLPPLATALRAHEALNRVYHVSPNDVDPYGCLILARRSLGGVKFEEKAFPTNMGRSLLLAHWTEGDVGQKIAVANVHLESLDNEPTRRAQLEIAASELAPYARAVLCGDFNFDARQKWGAWRKRPPPMPPHVPGALAAPPLRPAAPAVLENSVLLELLPSFTDAWAALHGAARDDDDAMYYTFDGAHNPHVHDPGERMRYDRVMLKGLTPASFALLGTPGSAAVVPSDHYGICVEARWVESGGSSALARQPEEACTAG